MSVKSLRVLILLANLALGAGVFVAGGMAFLSAIAQELPRREPRYPKADASRLPIERIPPIGRYAGIWSMKATPGDNEIRTPVVEQKTPDSKERILAILKSLFDIMGIIYNRTKPDDSYAVLRLLRENRAQTVTPGTTIQGATVESIAVDALVFNYNGLSVPMPMGGQPGGDFTVVRGGGPDRPRGLSTGARPPAGRPGPTDMSFSGPGFGPNGTLTDVNKAFPNSRRVNPTQWQVERKEVQYIQAQQGSLLNQCRPTLHVGANGRTEGVQIKAVPPNSLAAARGFQAGDIIKAVNNQPMNNLDFSSIGQRLRGARTAVVQVIRRGRPITLTYTLR